MISNVAIWALKNSETICVRFLVDQENRAFAYFVSMVGVEMKYIF
jgi:hypothetical protein